MKLLNISKVEHKNQKIAKMMKLKMKKIIMKIFLKQVVLMNKKKMKKKKLMRFVIKKQKGIKKIKIRFFK